MTAGGFRSFNATSPQRRHQLPKLEINATSDQRCVSMHLPTSYKNSANAMPTCFGVEVVGCLRLAFETGSHTVGGQAQLAVQCWGPGS